MTRLSRNERTLSERDSFQGLGTGQMTSGPLVATDESHDERQIRTSSSMLREWPLYDDTEEFAVLRVFRVFREELTRPCLARPGSASSRLAVFFLHRFSHREPANAAFRRSINDFCLSALSSDLFVPSLALFASLCQRSTRRLRRPEQQSHGAGCRNRLPSRLCVPSIP